MSRTGGCLTDKQLRGITKLGDHSVGGVAGLVLRLRTNSKTFVLRYRNSSGDQRSYTIGAYPTEVTLRNARRIAETLRTRIRSGGDPVGERAERKDAKRMSNLLGTDDETPGWYLGVYVQTSGRISTGQTPSGISTYTAYIRKHLRKPPFLKLQVSEVTAAHLNRIKARTPRGTWRKLREVLHTCFKYAEKMGWIPPGTNPAAQTTAMATRKVERYLTPEERKTLAEVLDASEMAPGYIRAIKLLLLSGMRRGEVCGLRWEFIDWKQGELRLPTSKTGAKSVPLSPQAMQFLHDERGDIPRLGGPVCTNSHDTPLRGDNLTRAWRVVRKTAGLQDVRLHDIRHSWASDSISAGVPLATVGVALGHKSTQTTARYAHLHNSAIRDGLAKTGDAIEKATEGR